MDLLMGDASRTFVFVGVDDTLRSAILEESDLDALDLEFANLDGYAAEIDAAEREWGVRGLPTDAIAWLSLCADVAAMEPLVAWTLRHVVSGRQQLTEVFVPFSEVKVPIAQGVAAMEAGAADPGAVEFDRFAFDDVAGLWRGRARLGGSSFSFKADRSGNVVRVKRREQQSGR